MMERKFAVQQQKNNNKRTGNSLVSMSIKSVATRATLHLEICLKFVPL